MADLCTSPHETENLFISLFIYCFLKLKVKESCLSALVSEQKSCREKCCVMQSDSCDVYFFASFSTPLKTCFPFFQARATVIL